MNVCRSLHPWDWCLKSVTWRRPLLLLCPEQEFYMLTNRTWAGTRESHNMYSHNFEAMLFLYYLLYHALCMLHQSDSEDKRTLNQILIRSAQQYYKMSPSCSGTLPAGSTNENGRQKGPTSPYCLKNTFLVVWNRWETPSRPSLPSQKTLWCRYTTHKHMQRIYFFLCILI